MSTSDAIFMHNDIKDLFRNKVIIVLGDSIQRSVYKDLVCLYSDPLSGYVHDFELRAKGELSFRNDKLIQGGVLAEKANSTNYREEREYRDKNSSTVFRFYFITRCWNEYVKSIVRNDMTTIAKPDVIIMNSCLWDIHHYGEEGKQKYEFFMSTLFDEIKRLPSKPLLVWNAALPLAEYCKGGFLRKGFRTLPAFEVERGNVIAHRQTHRYNFLFVDLYRSICRHQIFKQAEDGIHWSNKAHRNMTNSILAEICHRWKITVPVPVTLLPPINHQLELLAQPLIPQLIFTPPVHIMPRYHPYFGASMIKNRAFHSMGHRRSFTDPFPVASSYLDQQEARNNRYRARFSKMAKLKTPDSSPALPKPTNRRPLAESNSGTMATSSSETKTTSSNNSSESTSKNLAKDLNECSDVNSNSEPLNTDGSQLTNGDEHHSLVDNSKKQEFNEEHHSLVDNSRKQEVNDERDEQHTLLDNRKKQEVNEEQHTLVDNRRKQEVNDCGSSPAKALVNNRIQLTQIEQQDKQSSDKTVKPTDESACLDRLVQCEPKADDFNGAVNESTQPDKSLVCGSVSDDHINNNANCKKRKHENVDNDNQPEKKAKVA